MSPKSLTSLFVLVLVLSSVSAYPHDWRPIPDVKAPEVQAAAKFAVAEHNEAKKTKLEYNSIVKGVVEGVNVFHYHLIILAHDDQDDAYYSVVVYVDPSALMKRLVYFKLGRDFLV